MERSRRQARPPRRNPWTLTSPSSSRPSRPGRDPGRLDTLRLIGSGGANRAMEAEMKRLAPRALGRIQLDKPIRVDEQTLLYPFDVDLAWFAVRYLRTPSRVLWDLGRTGSERLEPLYDEVLAWFVKKPPAWMANGQTISVAVNNVYNFAAGPLQIRGTIKNAIFDGARKHGISLSLDPDRPDVQISVRGGDEQYLDVSVDLGGQSMHARGYRGEHGDAPLKENIAAQMIMLSRWDARREVLVDPMCGAGTIAIEADAMARGAPLWVGNKKPAAAWLPPFEGRPREAPDLFEGTVPHVVGGELDLPTLNMAKRNAERAGAKSARLLHTDFRALTRDAIASACGAKKDAPLLVLTNPPYGERLDRPDALYGDLADWWRGLGDDARIGLLVEDAELVKRTFGRDPKLEKPLHNGPLKTRIMVY